jgi:hypothetical protein
MLTGTLPELRKLFPWQSQRFHIQCLVLNIVVRPTARLHKVIAHVEGFQACNHRIRHTSISSSRHLFRPYTDVCRKQVSARYLFLKMHLCLFMLVELKHLDPSVRPFVPFTEASR